VHDRLLSSCVPGGLAQTLLSTRLDKAAFCPGFPYFQAQSESATSTSDMTSGSSPTPFPSSNNFDHRGPLIYRMHRLAYAYALIQQSIESLTIENNDAAKQNAGSGSDPRTVLSDFGEEPIPEASYLLKPSDEEVVQETKNLSLEQLEALEELGEDGVKDLKLRKERIRKGLLKLKEGNGYLLGKTKMMER